MRISLPEGEVEAAWWGPPPEAAPTLVLLHQGLGSVGLWGEFPARLAEATGMGVFAWSRLGYGRSDPLPLPWPLTFMHAEAARRVRPVLDAAGVRRCVLVGHSDGGSIALLYAGTEADPRVAGLALLAPHLFVEDVTVAGIEAARRRWEAGELRPRLARHHAHVDVAFGGWCGAWLSPGFREWSIAREAAGVRVPVLFVQGTADPYGTVAQLHAAERAAPGRVEGLVLEGCGHDPHAEAPAETLAAVAGFARRVLQDNAGTA